MSEGPPLPDDPKVLAAAAAASASVARDHVESAINVIDKLAAEVRALRDAVETYTRRAKWWRRTAVTIGAIIAATLFLAWNQGSRDDELLRIANREACRAVNRNGDILADLLRDSARASSDEELTQEEEELRARLLNEYLTRLRPLDCNDPDLGI